MNFQNGSPTHANTRTTRACNVYKLGSNRSWNRWLGIASIVLNVVKYCSITMFKALRKGKLLRGSTSGLVLILSIQSMSHISDRPNRYDRLTTRAALSAIPNFHWCMRLHCEAGQIHDSTGPFFECEVCHYQYCLHHKTPWHEDETCAEYTQRVTRNIAAEERASRETVKAISKPCPGCKAPIQKISGCKHMRCRKCSYQFCWCCLKKYPAHKRGHNIY
jgi:hypothetical protein